MKKYFQTKTKEFFTKKRSLSPETKANFKLLFKILFFVGTGVIYWLLVVVPTMSFVSFGIGSETALWGALGGVLVIFWGLFFYRKYLLTVGILIYLFSWAMSEIEIYRDRLWDQKNTHQVIESIYSPDTKKIDDTFKIVQTVSDTSLIFKDQVIKTWEHKSNKSPFIDFAPCDQLAKSLEQMKQSGSISPPIYNYSKTEYQKAWGNLSKEEQSSCLKDVLAKSITWSGISEPFGTGGAFFHIKWFYGEGLIFDTTNSVFIDGFRFGTSDIKRVYSYFDLFGFVVENSDWRIGQTVSFYDRKQRKIIKEWNTNGTESLSVQNIIFLDSRRVEIKFKRDLLDEPPEVRDVEPEQSITLDLY